MISGSGLSVSQLSLLSWLPSPPQCGGRKGIGHSQVCVLLDYSSAEVRSCLFLIDSGSLIGPTWILCPNLSQLLWEASSDYSDDWIEGMCPLQASHCG